MTQKNKTTKLVLTACFIALGIVLPFVTMQIPSIGNMLCPMHIPILLCGFICGAPYGLIAGIIVPLLRSVMFGKPQMMPIAIAMAAELATYGLATGLLYSKLRKFKGRIYVSLIFSMILGRMVWGIVSFGLFHMLGNPFTWKFFVMQAFIKAIPGIIIQLVCIPVIVYQLQRVQTLENSNGRA
ncbi:ECF transporter S component [Anaerosporobacter sp.]|uniref:ECF transporter S component n=1 Tax=Anaerosporobacter sp. TaxID=1872529 RepID=UPI00286F90D3|nr:ECF transporter S component [Anaerosporobacter sp.]